MSTLTLLRGTRLGPYEIVALLGMGGMGQVYRARDTRLDRSVAIKVLAQDLAADTEFRARFDREARAISQLTHPHICTLHDIGDHAGAAFLVMELLQGQTLADRLKKGALPLDEAMTVAVEMADALSAAHRHGVVHRDFKPANIMLTKTGAKLLDFGLAKAVAPAVAMIANSTNETATPRLTGRGSILGTLHYMSPEQVEGRETDTRSDMWALGAVIYEMVAGQLAFAGDSSAAVVGAVLKDRPLPLVARRPDVPAALDHLVAQCLEKDADDRWQSAGDLRRALALVMTTSLRARTATPTTVRQKRVVIPWLLLTVALTALALTRPWRLYSMTPTLERQRTVLSIEPPTHVHAIGPSSLSADGRSFVFVGLSSEGAPSLWFRSLDTGLTRELPGTEEASYPFWSPRGDALGFFADGKLKTVALTGTPPRVLAPAPGGRGGAWGTDGSILYAPNSNTALYRVSERGGETTQATTVDESRGQIGHRWPVFIDDRHFVFTVQAGSPDATGIYLGELGGRATTKLVGAYSNAAFVDGRLLYVVDGMIMARPFEVTRGGFTGDAVEAGGPTAFAGGLGFGTFSVSATGLLAFRAGVGPSLQTAMRWLDRQGRSDTPLVAGTEVSRYNSYSHRLSPDGRRLITAVFPEATSDLWLVDVERDSAIGRFTFDKSNDNYAVWSPDGTEILFSSNRGGVYNMYRKAASGSSEERLFKKASTNQYSTDWSNDGRLLIYTNVDPITQSDIWMTSATGGGTPVAVLATGFNEFGGRLSPDGHWIAYTSDESGRLEVYVRRFPLGGDKLQLSTKGGSEPQWRSDGRELFYVSANRTLFTVPITIAGALTAGRPAKVSDTVIDTSLGPIHATHYAASSDGQRFLVNVQPDMPMLVVLNWAEHPKK